MNPKGGDDNVTVLAGRGVSVCVVLRRCCSPRLAAVLTKEPAGRPLSSRVAARMALTEPSSGVNAPLLPLRSVATLPGSTALTLMPSGAGSLANATATALTAAFEEL